MKKEKLYTIRFSFEQEGIQPVVVQNVEPGQSLLEVVLSNNIALHHNCGGICSCSTCHLYIEKGGELVDERSVKEEHFVARAMNPRISSRLACQCLLAAKGGEIEVMLPDQRNILSKSSF